MVRTSYHGVDARGEIHVGRREVDDVMAFVTERFAAGWPSLGVLDADGVEVGGIVRNPGNVTRNWWAEGVRPKPAVVRESMADVCARGELRRIEQAARDEALAWREYCRGME